MTPIRFGFTAALGAKALIGGAIVALAAGAAGTAATGSANPMAWGQHVSEAVEQCKAADANVGQCVSAIARQHGEQMRAEHSQTHQNGTPGPGPSARPGQREGQENGQSSANGGNGAANGQGQNQSAGQGQNAGQSQGQNHGHPKPSAHP